MQLNIIFVLDGQRKADGQKEDQEEDKNREDDTQMCTDRSRQCPRFKSGGYCTSEKEVRTMLCRRTCGSCGKDSKSLDLKLCKLQSFELLHLKFRRVR